mgnify:FL=1
MVRTVSATCVECESTHSVDVEEAKHDRYLMHDGLVQNLFPKLTAPEREIVIQADKPWSRSSWATFMCEACWPEDDD